MEKVFFDADHQIAGRLATKAAKEALKGKHVFIVNAQRAVISGNPVFVINHYREKVSRGNPYHGPFYPRIPDRMLKRIIRGMLPKKPAGRDAFKRIRVYNSVPEEFAKQALLRPERSESKLGSKFITLGKLSERLGAKKTWTD
jgi:large subunit ribosomal protein L13